MTDIFDTKILCKNCNKEMKQTIIERDGAELRAVKCSDCGDVIIHPADLNSFEHFKDLKGKTFNVKLRVVGNSHAISIPKEIINFMNEMNRAHSNARREMDDMVRLCFEDFRRLSVVFGDFDNENGRRKISFRELEDNENLKNSQAFKLGGKFKHEKE